MVRLRDGQWERIRDLLPEDNVAACRPGHKLTGRTVCNKYRYRGDRKFPETTAWLIAMMVVSECVATRECAGFGTLWNPGAIHSFEH